MEQNDTIMVLLERSLSGQGLHDILAVNPLNATGVYIRLIFTSRERERRIYTPAIYSGPYRANRRSLAAVRGKTLLI